MKPGRDLDALIAEKVMRWERIPRQHPEIEAAGGMWRTPKGPRMCHAYSTDIAAAWMVVGAMRAMGWRTDMREVNHITANAAGIWWKVVFSGPSNFAGEAKADTAPHAICLAALKALGVEVPE